MQQDLRVLHFSVGPLDNNTYLVADEAAAEAVVVDPSFGSRPVLDAVRDRGWRIAAIVNTHCHLDHVVENRWFVEQTGAPLVLHAGELPLMERLDAQAAWMGVPVPDATAPGRLVEDGESLAVGAGALRVVLTPGHSPGRISLLGPGFVIVGDVLFAGSIGRTDLPGGSLEQLLDSIRRRLLVLPDETIVYPGHGPETTIGRERRSNPFLAGLETR